MEKDSTPTYIKSIDCSGTNEGRPLITLSIEPNLDQIIVWDLDNNNCEYDSFDVSPFA